MEKNKPSRPKPLTKGQRIARIVGGVSGMRDQLSDLKQNALDVTARCQLIRDENEVVEILTGSQLDAVLKTYSAFFAIFDEIDALEKLISEIEKRLRGEV